MIFKNKEHAFTQLLDTVKLLSFLWLAKFYNFVIGYHSW